MPLKRLTEELPNDDSGSTTPGTGSLFGSAQPAAAAASTPKPGGLFGTNTTTTPQQPPPQQQGTSLFGSAATTTTTQRQQAPSLFASTAATQPQPPQQQAGGLFGVSPQAQTQAQPQTQSTGGLFGNLNAVGQANPAGTGGLGPFAGSLSNPAQSTSNATGTSVFGQPAQQRPGLFGGVAQSTPAQQSSVFGQPQPQPQQQQPAAGFAGGLGFGLSMGQPNAQTTVPGVRIDVTNLKGTTRFNDLQEDLQNIVQQADTFIAEQMRRKEEVDSFMSGHREMLESVPNDVTFVTRKYDGAQNALESAAQSIEAARVLVNQDADHARLSFRAIDNLKLPQQYHTSNFWSPRQQTSGNANAETDGQDLVGFFSKAADEMGDQMRKYEGNLTEIELHLHGVENSLVEQLQRMMATKNSTSSGTDERIQELVAVLREFEQGILKVAGDVGSAREGMTRLQLGEFMSHDRSINGVY